MFSCKGKNVFAVHILVCHFKTYKVQKWFNVYTQSLRELFFRRSKGVVMMTAREIPLFLLGAMILFRSTQGELCSVRLYTCSSNLKET